MLDEGNYLFQTTSPDKVRDSKAEATLNGGEIFNSIFMKKSIAIVCCLIWIFSFGQSDSLLIATSGPAMKRNIETVLIVNGFLISDTQKANSFMKTFSNLIVKRKYFSSEAGFNKWGIISKDGVLFCRTRRGVIIDLEEMKEKIYGESAP